MTRSTGKALAGALRVLGPALVRGSETSRSDDDSGDQSAGEAGAGDPGPSAGAAGCANAGADDGNEIGGDGGKGAPSSCRQRTALLPSRLPTMSDWEKLAEARIREWLRRPPEDRSPRRPDDPCAPLETQLLDQALELSREARELPDGPDRKALLRQASAVETRLLILLESSGRPLAAARIAELLLQAKARLPVTRG